MSWMDITSSIFQGGAGLFVGLNIIQLYKDKRVKGVSWICNTWMVLWGIFSPFYFYDLHQLFSMWSAIFILIMNTIWTIQIIYFIRKEKNEY